MDRVDDTDCPYFAVDCVDDTDCAYFADCTVLVVLIFPILLTALTVDVTDCTYFADCIDC